MWLSAPSTVVLMDRLKMLKAGRYPTLRWALFCGETLPAEIADRFAQAAPDAVIENLYGPTELTIACAAHRWEGTRAGAEVVGGLVPIGEAFPGMDVLICDETLHEVPRGAPGELLMTGPQMALGYLDEPERTAQAFVVPPGHERTFYRTGDRVCWPIEQPMHYLGRVDDQLKIRGYCVEPGEVESVLREVSGASVAVALGWPRTPAGAEGLVGFVRAPHGDAEAILAAAKERLPPYMHPSAVRLVRDFPLNSNGKVDRSALLAGLQV